MSRLPSILLACYNGEKIDSVHHTLSKYLLEHIDQLEDLNIRDMADACFVSTSTISRFCKSIGLSDFNQLKQEFYDIDFYRDQKFNQDFSLLDIANEIIELHHTLDMSQINKLIKDIYSYKNVAVFGSMQALNPAIFLQQELYVSRKIVCCKEGYKNQLDYFKQATSEDLIIIFSATGSYFNIVFERQHHIPLLEKPKVVLITYCQDLKSIEGIDDIIYVKNDSINYMNHPLKFNLIANIIAKNYALYCYEKEGEKL